MFARVGEENQLLERDRLSILLAVTLTGATLFRFVELPTFSWSVRRIFGSPLGFNLGGDWLLSLLMMGLVASGTFSLLRAHPQQASKERPILFSLITPTFGALFASLLLIRAASWPIWLGSLVLTGLLIGLLVHLTYAAFSVEAQGYVSARTLLNMAVYLLGFLLFSMVFEGRERALVRGPLIFILSGLWSLDLLSSSGAEIRSVALFSSVIAVLSSELSWVLGYWPVSSWAAAILLSLWLYLGTGLSYQYLLGKLRLQIWIEFVVLALAVFILVLVIRP